MGEVKRQGLLEIQPLYYTYKIFTTILLLSASISLLISYQGDIFVLILNAFLMAVAFMQAALIGHDLGHHQIIRSQKAYEIFGVFFWNFILGGDLDYWNYKHNRHHAHPNSLEEDPDADFSVLKFSKSQVAPLSPAMRNVIHYQAYYFLPLLTLTYVGMIIDSVAFLLKQIWKRSKMALLKIFLLISHYIIFFALVFALLPFWQGVLFTVVFSAATGLYMGMAFAPNHKGMAIIERGEVIEPFRQQVITSRNITPNAFTDFLYGGLNYQIEHHLFPMMPRNNLKKARPLVKDFCAQNGIHYHETDIFPSVKEILVHLQKIAASAKMKDSVI